MLKSMPSVRTLQRLWISCAVVTISALLSGCNSSQNVGQYGILGACGVPENVQVNLVYPAPNSTGAPDNFNKIVLGSSTTLNSAYTAYVVNPTSNVAWTFSGVQPYASPLPTPYATPSFPNPVYQYSSSPGITWPANQTVYVYLAIGVPGECTPSLLLGAFAVAATPSPAPSPSPSHT